MRKINNFDSFLYLEQGKKNMRDKINLVNQVRNQQFENSVIEGKKIDFVESVIRKESKMNENYNLLLEDRQLLSEVKLDACRSSYLEGVRELKSKCLDYLYESNASKTVINIFDTHFLDMCILEKEEKTKRPWWRKALDNIGTFIYDNILEPGYKALKTCMVGLFGEEFVARVEKWGGELIGKVTNAIDNMASKVGTIFDNVYKTLKDIIKNIGKVVKDILAAIVKIFKMLVGIILAPIKKKADKIKRMENALKTAEEDSGEEGKPFITKCGEELAVLGQSVKKCFNFFTRRAQEGNEDSKELEGELLSSSKEVFKEAANEKYDFEFTSDHAEEITYSLLHTVNKHSGNYNDIIYLHQGRLNEGSEKKDGRWGYVRKWITSTVLWLFSWAGQVVEKISQHGFRYVVGALDWMGTGFKESFKSCCDKFNTVSILIGVISGLIMDGLAFGGGLKHFLEEPKFMKGEGKSFLEKIKSHFEHPGQAIGLTDKHGHGHGEEIAKHGTEGVKGVAAKIGEIAKDVTKNTPHLKEPSVMQDNYKYVHTKFDSFIKEAATTEEDKSSKSQSQTGDKKSTQAQKDIEGKESGEGFVIPDSLKDKEKQNYFKPIINFGIAASSALIGFLVGACLSIFPWVGIGMEALSVVLLVFQCLVLFTQHSKNKTLAKIRYVMDWIHNYDALAIHSH